MGAVAVSGIAAAPGHAAPGALFGIKDDAWLIYGPGTLDSRLDELDRLGVDIVRFTLHWDAIARRRPADATDPSDRAYRWGAGDAVLRGLNERGIATVVTLVGTPGWANGNLGPSWAPIDSSAFGDFAFAAAERYPFVRRWTVWNEPNQRVSLRPTRADVYVVRLLNPAYRAIKRSNPRALVAGGVTAPRGGSGGVSPLAWIAGMAKAGALLDAYAHHPYPLVPKVETPSGGGCAHCETVTMATLERLITAVRRSLGPKRIWLTEYGYQTNPPDNWLGISLPLQARYVAEAGFRVWKLPYVDMLINFLLRDDVADWQSGFYSVSGDAKPSLAAFTLPLAQVSRSGARTKVWGQVRPGSGRRLYRLQVLRGSWRWLTPVATTSASGTFVRTVTVAKGAHLRIWSPADSSFGAPLSIQ